MKNGTILYNGEPFFVFGFNHDSAFVPKEALKDAINKVADAGYNTMYIQPSEKQVSEIELAKTKDIKLIIDDDGAQDDGLKGVINAFKKYSNVLSWRASDDFNSGTPMKPYSIAQAKIAEIEKLDNTRPTFISGTAAKDRNPVGYMDNLSSELVAIQNYPIGDRTAHTYDIYEYMFRMVREANKRGKALIAQLQTFDWKDKGSRLPTYAEVRNMTYQSIVAGVNGILYYTFASKGWDLGKNALWNELKELPKEINPLLPVILNGEFTPYTDHISYVKSKYIAAAGWVYEGESYLIVVNTSDKKQTGIINISDKDGAFTKEDGSDVNIIKGSNTFIMEPLEVLVLIQEKEIEEPPIEDESNKDYDRGYKEAVEDAITVVEKLKD